MSKLKSLESCSVDVILIGRSSFCVFAGNAVEFKAFANMASLFAK
jgi:hypothetical protein